MNQKQPKDKGISVVDYNGNEFIIALTNIKEVHRHRNDELSATASILKTKDLIMGQASKEIDINEPYDSLRLRLIAVGFIFE